MKLNIYHNDKEIQRKDIIELKKIKLEIDNYVRDYKFTHNEYIHTIEKIIREHKELKNKENEKINFYLIHQNPWVKIVTDDKNSGRYFKGSIDDFKISDYHTYNNAGNNYRLLKKNDKYYMYGPWISGGEIPIQKVFETTSLFKNNINDRIIDNKKEMNKLLEKLDNISNQLFSLLERLNELMKDVKKDEIKDDINLEINTDYLKNIIKDLNKEQKTIREKYNELNNTNSSMEVTKIDYKQYVIKYAIQILILIAIIIFSIFTLYYNKNNFIDIFIIVVIIIFIVYYIINFIYNTYTDNIYV